MAETMTASAMTDGQIDNIVDKFRAALRKHRFEITSDVAQQVCGVENLGMECYAVVRKHANQLRNVVRLTITTVKEFVKPSWMEQLKGNEPREPGDYEYIFEELPLHELYGFEMVRRTKASGATAGLQDALYFLDNQHFIPEEFRGKRRLIFADTRAFLPYGVHRGDYVAYLLWDGLQRVLGWSWLGGLFTQDECLLVRARKIPARNAAA